MATTRSELSKRNPWRIDKDRYLELKHFCAQIPMWKAECALNQASLVYFPEIDLSLPRTPTNDISRPVESSTTNERILDLQYRIKLFNDALAEVWPSIGLRAGSSKARLYFEYALCKQISYDKLAALHPEIVFITRDQWYDMYRRFFYILDKSRK